MLNRNDPRLKLDYLADLSDIPDELRKELTILNPAKSHLIQQHFIEALHYFGGIASMDEMLVYAYREHGAIYRKPYVYNVISELRQNGILGPADGKRRALYKLLKEPEQAQEQQPEPEQIHEEQAYSQKHEEEEPAAKKKELTELDQIYLDAFKTLGAPGTYDDILKLVNKKYKTHRKAVGQTIYRLYKKGFVRRVSDGVYEPIKDF